jgi:hypothetical protein
MSGACCYVPLSFATIGRIDHTLHSRAQQTKGSGPRALADVNETSFIRPQSVSLTEAMTDNRRAIAGGLFVGARPVAAGGDRLVRGRLVNEVQ